MKLELTSEKIKVAGWCRARARLHDALMNSAIVDLHCFRTCIAAAAASLFLGGDLGGGDATGTSATSTSTKDGTICNADATQVDN